MVSKVFEVRDRATCIPVLATQFGSENAQERWLFWRAGFSRDDASQKEHVLLVRIIDCNYKASADPYSWGDRTYQTAHIYISKNFDKLRPGQVIDVEFILGEVEVPKISERDTVGA
jgi:hypothetical protein